jgi:hypothetical protein
MVVKVKNVGDNLKYSFDIFNIKCGEPLNLNKLVFSSKNYAYAKDLDNDVNENYREYKLYYREYRYIPFGKEPPPEITGWGHTRWTQEGENK